MRQLPAIFSTLFPLFPPKASAFLLRRVLSILVTLLFISVLMMASSVAAESKSQAIASTETKPQPKAQTKLQTRDLLVSPRTGVQIDTVWGIFIGVSRYLVKGMDLNFADEDAKALHTFYTKHFEGLVPADHFKLLVDQQVTRGSVFATVREVFGRANAGDLVVLFLAMHGQTDISGQDLYFVTHETDPNAVYDRGISRDDLMKHIANSKARKVILFLDVCHAASFGTSSQLLATRSADAADVNRLVLAMGQARDGWAVMASSGAAERSQESRQFCDGHGAFTCGVLTGLKGEADEDRNTLITVRELYDHVYRKVKDLTQGAQNPAIQGNYDNELPLALAPGVKSAPRLRAELGKKEQELRDLEQQEHQLMEEADRQQLEEIQQQIDQKKEQIEQKKKQLAERQKQGEQLQPALLQEPPAGLTSLGLRPGGKPPIEEARLRPVQTRGWIGIGLQEVAPELAKSLKIPEGRTGVRITHLYKDSPAAAAGLQLGDVIMAWNQKDIRNMAEFEEIYRSSPVGSQVKVRALRNGGEKEVGVMIRPRPSDEDLARLQLQPALSQESPNGLTSLGLPPGVKPPIEEARLQSHQTRGWIGIGLQEVAPELAKSLKVPKGRTGVLITHLYKDSPAAAAGLQLGDVIMAWNQKDIRNMAEFEEIYRSSPVGSQVKVRALRNGGEKEIRVMIRQPPSEEDLARLSQSDNVLAALRVRLFDADTARGQYHSVGEGPRVVIEYVEPGSPANEAGLQHDDVIAEINHDKINGLGAYAKASAKIKNNEPTLFLVNRQGENLSLVVNPK